MSHTMDPQFSQRLNDAYDEVEAVPGIFVLGLSQPSGGNWTATVALEDLSEERLIHADDPSLFRGVDDDAPTALRLALAAAKKALGL